MQTLLLVAEMIIAIALIGFVLLQRSEGGALGMGWRQQHGRIVHRSRRGRHLDPTTSILAFLFFTVCIVLNILALKGRDQTSILDSAPVTTPLPAKRQQSSGAAAGWSFGSEPQ
jgi:preprotein translocase subunit SecG